jgi:hypothetical protein
MIDHPNPPREISEKTAKRVANFMVDYLLPNAARFYVEILGQKDNYEHAKWVAGYILTHNFTKITARDIGRGYRELRGDLKATQEAMTVLFVAGWVSPIDGEKRHGLTKWAVNPRVHTLFAARAAAERQRREEIKRKIREAAQSLGLSPDEDEEAAANTHA